MMRAYLMAQGQWMILGKTRPTSIDTVTAAQVAADKSLVEIDGNEEDVEKWDETNGKALGNMTLHLHHTLSHKYHTQGNTGALWMALENNYGKPGLISTYLEFKAAMEI
jgi:hypothetical protein